MITASIFPIAGTLELKITLLEDNTGLPVCDGNNKTVAIYEHGRKAGQIDLIPPDKAGGSFRGKLSASSDRPRAARATARRPPRCPAGRAG